MDHAGKTFDVVNKIFLPENELRLLDLIAAVIIGVSPIIHLILVRGVNAPYGRYTSKSWGFLVNARFAWVVQELPSLLIPLYEFFTTPTRNLSLASIILLALFMTHYVNRVVIYPLKIRGGKPTPFFVFLLATIFCTCNGYMQSAYLLRHALYQETWISEPNFIIGVCIFIWGFVTNIKCDDILRNLRKPNETGYKIPQGSMFEYVTGGNLFAEAVEWFGFAVACWSLQAASFSIFAFLYLSGRSHNHHVWYLKKFDNYPKRKIFLPFVL